MKGRLIKCLAVFFCLASMFGAVTRWAIGKPNQQSGGAPSVVSYQGQVLVDGTPYDGTGYFKFAIVNAAGTTTYWSNDGSASSGSEPDNSVSLPVSNGLFNVLLGETPTMDVALDDTVFSDPDTYLRVWFSEDDTTFTLLSDQKIAAVPYALQASSAENADALGGVAASGYQLQVTGNCPVGYAVRVVNADGSVTCERTNARPEFSITSYSDPATNAGWGPSMAIGVDGLPLIAYRQEPNVNLIVGHCQDLACTAMTVTEYPMTNGSGTYASIAIGTDGFGLIAHRHGKTLVVTHCNNITCTSADTYLIDDGSNNGYYPNLTIGTDGYGVISYKDFSSSWAVKVAHCTSVDCSTSEVHTIGSGDSSYTTSIAITLDNGFPVVTYQDWGLKIARCINANCSSYETYTLDPTNNAGAHSSIVIGTDGLPLISYQGYDTTHSMYNLSIAHCSNLSCSSADLYVIDGFANLGRSSFIIDPDGRGIVTYHDQNDGSLNMAYCIDDVCSSAVLQQMDSDAYHSHLGVDVTIGTDGMPIIAYSDEDGSTYHLKIMHCANRFCQPYRREW